MMARHRAQLTELLTNYGNIDMLSLDMWLGAHVWPQMREQFCISVSCSRTSCCGRAVSAIMATTNAGAVRARRKGEYNGAMDGDLSFGFRVLV